MLIPLREWAERRGVKLNTARKRVYAGALTATKIGRDLWIEENQEYTDRRFKNTTPAEKCSRPLQNNAGDPCKIMHRRAAGPVITLMQFSALPLCNFLHPNQTI